VLKPAPAGVARVDVRFVFCNVIDPVDAPVVVEARRKDLRAGARLHREHE
jgi:hypothetical protein